VEPTACPICEAIASENPEPRADACCDECTHLLRWFRSYFDQDPRLDVTWWIRPETTFHDLRVESLDWMSWLLEAEQKPGIDIPDKDAEKLRTVGQFVQYLRARGASWPSVRNSD
jgi:acyl carrier protein